MKKIGITGGIGTGKTTVCKMLEKLGVPVYYADDRAKWLMHHDENLKNSLIDAFGDNVYDSTGQLDRAYLGGIVFNDRSKLDILNSIVHPAVFQDGKLWQEEQEARGVPYSLKEAALLFETGSYQLLDKIIVVAAPEEIRIKRVMSRDNISREEVLARINKQMPQAEKIQRADYVIENIDLDKLELDVKKIHQQLLEYAADVN